MRYEQKMIYGVKETFGFVPMGYLASMTERELIVGGLGDECRYLTCNFSTICSLVGDVLGGL